MLDPPWLVPAALVEAGPTTSAAALLLGPAVACCLLCCIAGAGCDVAGASVAAASDRRRFLMGNEPINLIGDLGTNRQPAGGWRRTTLKQSISNEEQR